MLIGFIFGFFTGVVIVVGFVIIVVLKDMKK